MKQAACAAALVLAAATGAQAQPVAAPIDQGVRVGFSAAVRDVVVGNPAIADVTLLDARSAVLMGKSYGVTSLMAFDAAGRTVFNRQVVVSASDAGRVSMIRGGAASNYACGPRCERTPMPGEHKNDYGDYNTGFDDYAKRARGPTPAE
jgi:hypothetical protein